jgi:hypothetical protein
VSLEIAGAAAKVVRVVIKDAALPVPSADTTRLHQNARNAATMLPRSVSLEIARAAAKVDRVVIKDAALPVSSMNTPAMLPGSP